MCNPPTFCHNISMLYYTKVHETFTGCGGFIGGLCVGINVKCQHKQLMCVMPTCRRFEPQNWLLWQHPLTEVHQILAVGIFSSTVLMQQSSLRSVHPLSNEGSGSSKKKKKSSVKHKPAGDIAMSKRANRLNFAAIPSCMHI